MATQQNIIKTFIASLDKSTLKPEVVTLSNGTTIMSSENMLDEAITAATNGKFTSAQAVKLKMVHDNEISSSDTFLQKYCGIILYNDDTGAITGKDAGGSTKEKTAESIIPETGALKNFADSDTSFTVSGVKFTLGDGKIFKTLTGDEKIIWRGFCTWWAKNSLALIKESYGYSFEDSDATFTEISVHFSTNPPDPDWIAWSNANTHALTINMNIFSGITEDNVNGMVVDSYNQTQYLDRTLAHEITHLIMGAKIENFNILPSFIVEGTAELVHGIDDEKPISIRNLAQNYSWLKSYLNFDTTDDEGSYTYAAGYMFLRYLANQGASTGSSSGFNISNTKNNTTVSGSNYADDIYNAAGGVKVLGGNGNDYIYNSTEKNYTVKSAYGYVTIDGGAGNDTIGNYDRNVSLSGGAGDDFVSLEGHCPYVTINGGTGNDTISLYSTVGTFYQYASGDGADNIIGINSNDTIHITSGGIASSVTSGSDAILYIGKFAGLGDEPVYDNEGSITLKDYANKKFYLKVGTAAAKQVSINGSNGSAPSKLVSLTSGADKYENSVSGATIYGLAGNDTVSNKGTRTLIDGGAGKDTLRNYAGGVTLQGGAGDDYIYNSTSSTTTINSSYGYVTIDGGAGNDKIENNDPYVSISGGAGNDSIVVGSYNYVTVNASAGNDTVVGNRNTYGVLYQYRSGDGNDILTAVNVNDTIHITSGSVSKASVSGSDVILTVGSNTINLKNYKGKSFNLKIGSGSAVSTVISGSSSSVVSLTGGNDNYENTLDSATIYGLAGNDTIRNLGASKVMIDGGAGKDSIFSYGSGVTVNAGNDADYVYIYSDAISTTALGGAGNDSIYTAGQTVSVSGDAGNDYVYVYANATKTTVNGGAGNDSIYTAGQTVSASGGDGNDYIHVYSNATKTTVNGGKGSDTITSYSTLGTLYQYANGDGKDTITGFSANDTLHVTSGSVTSSVSGSNVILKVGSGTITLKDYKGKSFNLKNGSGSAVSTVIGGGSSSSVVSLTSGADKYENSVSGATIYGLGGNDTISNTTTNVTIYGGAGNDSIDNRNRNVLVYGDAGNDKILNTSTNVTIFGGAGADSIENHSASSGATIHGDAGNDTIKSNGSFAQIFGDAGNDKISLGSYAQNITVEGGAGNDTLYSNGASNLFRYSSGHGNDTIIGSGSNDTLQISASYTTSVKGSDLIVKVGSNSITVKNYSSSRINITRGGSNGYWFADDTNFLGSTTLDDISKVTAENYSVTELSAPDFENFAQDNFPTITSGEK